MPFVTAPPLIEQSDFTGGWFPDGPLAHHAPTELEDVNNLLLEAATGAIVTRNGFSRRTTPLTGTSGRWVISLFSYRAGAAQGRYLIAVTTDGSSNADNVQIFVIDASAWTFSRIDTAGRVWDNPTKQHWGMAIDNIWYGGVQGEPMYSYTVATDTWDADATNGNYKTVVDATGGGVNTATEYGRDFAWTGKERAVYGSDIYTPLYNIRYDTWEVDRKYTRGDRVSRKANGYIRSYRCIDEHKSSATDSPDDGVNWEDYWKRVTLDLPTNSDGETSDDWAFVPLAAQTSVTQWYGNRLWMRYDDQGDKSRLLYSAPVTAEKGVDVPDTVWDPRDFAPGSDLQGPGGGWVSFSDGKHDGSIVSLATFGQYLIVFKRKAVWVLSGYADEDFTVRKLANEGTVGLTTHCQHEGLLYFLGDDGIFVTDGTVVEPVPGSDKLRDWFRTRLDDAVKDSASFYPTMWSWREFVWVSIPVDGDSKPWQTIAYHPETGSFWRTDLPILDVTKLSKDGVQHLYFVTDPDYGLDIVYKYTGQVDDDGAALAVAPNTNDVDIDWYARTTFWPFGLARQDRRIRRTWALVKGAMNHTLKVWRNYDYDAGSPEGNVTRTVSGARPQYIEGQWVADCHSIELEISGPSAPAIVHGLAVETEPRRLRYHTGGS